MEVAPDQHVTIRLRDNTVREIAWDQIQRVEKSVAPPPSASGWDRSEERESARSERRRESARLDAVARLPTLAILGQLTPGGGADAEARVGSESESANESLLPGYGVSAEFSAPISRFFALGGLISYSRFKAQGASNALGFLDGAFVPRLQYAFGGDPLVMRAFFEVQIGIGWADLPRATNAVITSVNPVFDVGPSAGFELFVSERVGFVLKLGWLYHSLGLSAAADGMTGHTTYEYQTFFVQLGVMFALGSRDE